MATTPEECLDALWVAAEQLGESPSKAQYNELDISPSATTLVRIVGGWNEAKDRAGLKQYDGGERGGISIGTKPDDVRIPDDTGWDELTPQQRWYYKNRDHRIETKEKRRRELRKWFHRYKQENLNCERCGEDSAPSLDFHHVGEKELGVSQMVNHGYSRERIRSEMTECIILCANCHRKGHAENGANIELPPDSDAATDSERPGRPQRAWMTRYKRESDGCTECGETNPSCLDFHHTKEKTAGVGRMVSERRPIPEIKAELQRCELLCANCHRREHFVEPGT